MKSLYTSQQNYANCPACMLDSNPVWLNDHPETRYLRCRTCGTIYASPRLPMETRLQELRKVYHSSEETRRRSALRRPKLAVEARIIQNFINHGKLLDVGCGNGTMFEFFDDENWERSGVEISSSSADYAMATYNATVQKGNLLSAGFSSQHFDLVMMIDMLYFLDDPSLDFHEVRRIIKPDGYLAIEVPGLKYMVMKNHGFLSLFLNRKWDRLHSNSAYVNWFSLNGIRNLLDTSGFQLVYATGVGVPERGGMVPRVNIILASIVNQLIEYFPSLLSWSPKMLLIARPVYHTQTEELHT